MRRLWSEEHKRRLWRRIWVALAEAEHEAGLVCEAELADLRAHQDEVDIRVLTTTDLEQNGSGARNLY